MSHLFLDALEDESNVSDFDLKARLHYGRQPVRRNGQTHS